MNLTLYKYSPDAISLRLCALLSSKNIEIIEHENPNSVFAVYEENCCKLTSPFEIICYFLKIDSSTNNVQQTKALFYSTLRPFVLSSLSTTPPDDGVLVKFIEKNASPSQLEEILFWSEVYPLVMNKGIKMSKTVETYFNTANEKYLNHIKSWFNLQYLKEFVARVNAGKIKAKDVKKESKDAKKDTNVKDKKAGGDQKPKTSQKKDTSKAEEPKEAGLEIINIDITDKERQVTKKNFIHDEMKKEFKNIHPILPIEGKRNILVTSALPYVNNVPHLGNLIGSTLSAHVFSVYAKMVGHNCLAICGTDEYGTATETKAQIEGKSPREICDQYNKQHEEIYKWFGIDFDYFGRTTTPIHNEITHEIFAKLRENKFISQAAMDQLFCEQCQKFLADRYVNGICPLCAYDDARGDQCDKCGKIINAIDLKEPKCKICSSSPVIRSSNHLFFDLPKVEKDLGKFLTQRQEASDSLWSTNSITISRSWLRDGLKSRCITRDLKWGVPIPKEMKMDNKVFYVWFDAPIGYLSITSNYLIKNNCSKDDWRKWWQVGEKVELYQFMAKDNVPFHAIIFPCTLLASNSNFTMVKNLLSTEYMNYENTKFSKSRNIGVFGDGAMESNIHSDIWRFYLISIRPESQDSAFSWSDFMLRNNSELLNNLGNYINRALTFVAKFFDGTIPEMKELDDEDLTFIARVNRLTSDYLECMEKCRLREASRIILQISGHGNGYIQSKKPWVSMKNPEEVTKASACIGIAANVVTILALVLCPIMPKISREIWVTQCNLKVEKMTFLNLLQTGNPPASSMEKIHTKIPQFLKPGHKLGKVVPIFRKLEKVEVDSLAEKYGKV